MPRLLTADGEREQTWAELHARLEEYWTWHGPDGYRGWEKDTGAQASSGCLSSHHKLCDGEVYKRVPCACPCHEVKEA